MFKIGDFSILSNTSIRMLRHYDELDLLKPQKADELTGYRYYSANQLDRVNKISMLKALGFSLALIKEILNNVDDPKFMEKYLSTRAIELEEEKNKIKIQMTLLENVTSILKKGKVKNMYSVNHKKISSKNIASFRGIIPTYADEGMLWGKLFEIIMPMGAKFPKDAISMAVYHDDDYKEKDPDVEVQIEIEGNYSDKDGVKFFKTEEVEVASVTFRGSYDQVGDVAEAAANWIESSGYKINGHMFNIYYVSPSQDPNPENWVTESCYPVTKI